MFEKTLKPNLEIFERKLKDVLLAHRNELSYDIENFIFNNPKRLRPIFAFLVADLLNLNINEDVQNVALSLELLHSATLVHDDIIDESQNRRNNETFYSKFGAKRAVILGDYFLSLCLILLSKLNNCAILEVFSKNTFETLNGEINQFASRFNFQSENDYFKKTCAKTANLFLIAAKSISILANKNNEKTICDFALKFGTAFQLKNDIDNFLKTNPDDFQNGIFTLPLIYFKQENPNCDIINLSGLDKYIKKSADKLNELIDEMKALLLCEFGNKAQSLIEFTEKILK